MRLLICWATALAVCLFVSPVASRAGVIFGSNGNLGGGVRWDAAPRFINGNERSLDGGLRYSMQGGSSLAFRDLFTWNTVPTLQEFDLAISQAFGAWTAADPFAGYVAPFHFVNDTANTTVAGTAGFGGGIDFNGAEIDLFGMDAGDTGTRGVASFSFVGGSVTLTSGTAGYGGAGQGGGGAIRGADVYINSNSGAVYSLDLFRRLLTHELGHSLGIADAEDFGNNGFIDDNYDGSTSETALATLTNPWSHLVNPLNPANSPGLTHFAPGIVANGNPGLDTPGVNILMESQGLGISSGNPASDLFPLRADDYGIRQFLYPSLAAVPEPTTFVLWGAGIAVTAGYARRRRKKLRA